MPALSPKLPLSLDSEYGFAMNTTYAEMITQNFKYLLLTNPGERVMDPDFGVGLRHFLFEINAKEASYSKIKSRIASQTQRYIPFIGIDDVKIGSKEEAENIINIKVYFTIIPLGVSDFIDISFGNFDL